MERKQLQNRRADLLAVGFQNSNEENQEKIMGDTCHLSHGLCTELVYEVIKFIEIH